MTAAQDSRRGQTTAEDDSEVQVIRVRRGQPTCSSSTPDTSLGLRPETRAQTEDEVGTPADLAPADLAPGDLADLERDVEETREREDAVPDEAVEGEEEVAEVTSHMVRHVTKGRRRQREVLVTYARAGREVEVVETTTSGKSTQQQQRQQQQQQQEGEKGRRRKRGNGWIHHWRAKGGNRMRNRKRQ